MQFIIYKINSAGGSIPAKGESDFYSRIHAFIDDFNPISTWKRKITEHFLP